MLKEGAPGLCMPGMGTVLYDKCGKVLYWILWGCVADDGRVRAQIRQGHGKGTWHQMGLNFICFHFKIFNFKLMAGAILKFIVKRLHYF